MADLHKRLEKAEKYLQKGKQADALEEYLDILNDDPNNDSVRQSAADVALTMGRNDEAAKLLSVLFDRLAAANDQTKAIANYKKLLRSGKPTVDQAFRFAQFLEKTDRRASIEEYNHCVTDFTGAGRKDEALSALKRVVALDPSVENHRRTAEAAEALRDVKTAAASLLKLAELEPANAAGYLEKGYSLDSSNAALALAYGRSLVQSDAEKSIKVLAPVATSPEAGPEYREAYGNALIAGGKNVEAEPFIWELYEKTPNQPAQVADLIGGFLRSQQEPHALELARKLEQRMTKVNLRREYISLIKDITTKTAPGVPFLEYMVELYNSANREHDYCETLTALYQLHFAAGNFLRAADALDRAAEVDPYQQGNQKRLEMLRGKIDNNRFNTISNRLAIAGAAPGDEGKKEEEKTGLDKEPTVLEDFMLQAEIYIQYGMRSKAVERLERVNKLFPREEEKNEKLRNLYMNAGYVPKYAEATPASAATPSAATSSLSAAPMSPFGQAPSYGAGGGAKPNASAAGGFQVDENAVDNFGRVTEITRNIYRQATVKGVLFATVNDVGRHYNASRCIAGLITPGKPPSAALEYCAPGIKQSEVQHIVKLLGAVQAASVRTGIVSIPDAVGSPDLAAIKESVAALSIRSVLAVPLIDPTTDEHAGILILEQCDQPRVWRPTDAVVLKTISDQMVLAVNNAKLRSLMKNLAVTDEKSGLLKRSSYMDVLLSETKRALSQNSTASLLLFNFGKASAMVKEVGEPAVESMMQNIGQTICSQIRQNDVAVRYELATIGLILPDTTDKNAFFVVDKMRKALTGVRMNGADKQVPITVGIAEMVMHAQYDPIDIVTEAINRAEGALDAAKKEGPNTAKSLAPQFLEETQLAASS